MSLALKKYIYDAGTTECYSTISCSTQFPSLNILLLQLTFLLHSSCWLLPAPQSAIVIEENINELLPLANGHPLWFLFHPHSSSCHFPAPPGIVIKENINYLLPLPNWYPFQSLFPPHPSSSILPAPQSAIVVEHKDVICMLLSQVNWDPFDVDSLHPILVHQYQHQSLPFVSFLVLILMNQYWM
jgi:hypothetical protein